MEDKKTLSDDCPKALQDRIFKKVFDQAEIAKYSDLERRQYEESKKVFWDNYSVMKTATDKGRAEGRAEGLAEGEAKGRAEGLTEGEAKGRDEERKENARKMKKKGFAVEDIADITGLSIEDIERS